jgi:hypothetical protein
MIAIWDPRYSVGNALADAEHRQVISILNEIDVARSVGAPRIVVKMALETLVRTIESHFTRDREPQGDHLAIASAARRLLDAWHENSHAALERRILVNLAQRWIAHIGRRQGTLPAQRLAG